MPVQRSRDVAGWPSDPDDVARVVLDILVQRYPALIAVEELVRELCDPSLAQQVDEALVHDALLDLVTSGLVHRLDRFVFTTQAMLRAAQLGA